MVGEWGGVGKAGPGEKGRGGGEAKATAAVRRGAAARVATRGKGKEGARKERSVESRNPIDRNSEGGAWPPGDAARARR